VTPASGLVTAMDPVMRAGRRLGGAGQRRTADRETADASGRLSVPPEDPRFTLKEGLLTQTEEAGLYKALHEGCGALPHRAQPPALRIPPTGRTGAIRRSNEEVRGTPGAGSEIAANRVAIGPIQDYTSRCCLGDSRRGAPTRAHRPSLGTSVAELRGSSICPWQDELLLGDAGGRTSSASTQYLQTTPGHGGERRSRPASNWALSSIAEPARHLVTAVPIKRAPRFVDKKTRRHVSQELLAEHRYTAEVIGVGRGAGSD